MTALHQFLPHLPGVPFQGQENELKNADVQGLARGNNVSIVKHIVTVEAHYKDAWVSGSHEQEKKLLGV